MDSGMAGWVFSAAAGICWCICYICAIRRSFLDKAITIPLAATAMAIGWEFFYSFYYIPTMKIIHIYIMAWFFIDFIILIQSFMYGRNEPALKNLNFNLYFVVMLLINFLFIFGFIYHFADYRGWYTAMGINVIYSSMYIIRLINDDGNMRGQSMYVAILKWLGTLFFTLFMYNWWPSDPLSPLPATTPMEHYPMQFFMIVLTSTIAVLDIYYIFLIHGKFKAKGINPWNRV